MDNEKHVWVTYSIKDGDKVTRHAVECSNRADAISVISYLRESAVCGVGRCRLNMSGRLPKGSAVISSVEFYDTSAGKPLGTV